MTQPLLEARDLVKRYGVASAVDGLDLAVEAGGVFGFLGPNGSGKTTTIRMLLGLVRADTGRMRLFDHPVPEELPAVIGVQQGLSGETLLFPDSGSNVVGTGGAESFDDEAFAGCEVVVERTIVNQRVAAAPLEVRAAAATSTATASSAGCTRTRCWVIDEPDVSA